MADSPEYTRKEEIANSLTHGLGAALALGGLVVLILGAAHRGDAWHLTTSAIYGLTLIGSFLASTLYHAFSRTNIKRILRTIDHAAIFLLIAGTYTPFTLVTLRGPWGWALFGVIWGCAIAGIICEAAASRSREFLRVGSYVVMGWAVVIAVRPLLQQLDPAGFRLLVAGGLAYTGGIVFYAWRRIPYGHAIWHLFVLVGSALHFFAIFWYVIPHQA
ncbi:hemolysin III [Geothermobacter ehrlichii]|uniref:Hemolysin III n=1 Tax=Geothermobacter ehrlichii TaxID=213224 RepID=A0A5D3WIH4_9BACT|nr:hemolysin III family protein [Geothermobacter ehrlichii]TYO98264.1 hemolysin III [Geothermobacter ehrlichii]